MALDLPTDPRTPAVDPSAKTSAGKPAPTQQFTTVANKLKLKPGMAAEYKKRHDAIWPEVSQAIRAAGTSDYSIFLDEQVNIPAASGGAFAGNCRSGFTPRFLVEPTHRGVKPLLLPTKPKQASGYATHKESKASTAAAWSLSFTKRRSPARSIAEAPESIAHSAPFG